MGLHGDMIGLNRFGASAPINDIYAHLGFTPEHIAQRALAVLERAALSVIA